MSRVSQSPDQLAGILGMPMVSGLFAFGRPTPLMLLAGVGAAVLSLFWFEAVKWGLGRRTTAAA